jgi:glycerate-2-kinase
MNSNPHLTHLPLIIESAIAAADPGRAVTGVLCRTGNTLALKTGSGVTNFELDKFKRIIVAGIGKAAAAMAMPLLDMLPRKNCAALSAPNTVTHLKPHRLTLLKPDIRCRTAGVKRRPWKSAVSCTMPPHRIWLWR